MRKRKLRQVISYNGQFPEEDSRNLPRLFEFMAKQPVSSEFEAWCFRSGWNLSGHGNSYVDCGHVLARGCVSRQDHPGGKDFVRLFKRNCRRKACPVCYESWASAQAERSLIRLSASVFGYARIDRVVFKAKADTWRLQRRFFHERLQIDLEGMLKTARQKVIHVVFSPPQDVDIDNFDYPVFRRKAYAVAKRVGFDGGCLIFHPFRLRCVVCKSSIADYKRVCSCGSKVFEWYFSPHSHGVGFGWIVGSDVEFKRSGWIVRNLGVRKSVFWTMQYLLSHAGVFTDPSLGDRFMKKRKYHVVTWFGVLAYCKLRVPKVGSFSERCPYCARFLKPLVFVQLDRPPPLYDVEDFSRNEFLIEKGVWMSV